MIGEIFGATGWDPNVCKSNWLHIDILLVSFIKLGYILQIPLKWLVIFLQSWTSTGYFSNSTGSFVTNCRFSPIIAAATHERGSRKPTHEWEQKKGQPWKRRSGSSTGGQGKNGSDRKKTRSGRWAEKARAQAPWLHLSAEGGHALCMTSPSQRARRYGVARSIDELKA